MDGHKLELTEELVDLLKRSTDGHQFWAEYLEKLSVSEPIPFSVHLAILLEPYLQYVLDGTKTVESRFSKNRIAPYNMVEPGDVVLLKKVAARSISGVCVVRKVWFYQLNPETWSQIRNGFSRALRADDPSFWERREMAQFATLMRIAEVHPLPPIEVPKRDRRGWVILRAHRQATLNFDEVTKK